MIAMPEQLFDSRSGNTFSCGSYIHGRQFYQWLLAKELNSSPGREWQCTSEYLLLGRANGRSPSLSLKDSLEAFKNMWLAAAEKASIELDRFLLLPPKQLFGFLLFSNPITVSRIHIDGVLEENIAWCSALGLNRTWERHLDYNSPNPQTSMISGHAASGILNVVSREAFPSYGCKAVGNRGFHCSLPSAWVKFRFQKTENVLYSHRNSLPQDGIVMFELGLRRSKTELKSSKPLLHTKFSPSQPKMHEHIQVILVQ